MMPPKQFQSVRYVMLYLLFGLLWIHGSDTIIALLVSDVDAFEWISRLKGSVFVAISGGFLYLALVRWPAPVDRLFLQGRAQWWIVLGLLLLVFIMPLVGGALVHWFDSAQAADGHHLPLSLLAGVAAMVLSGLLITLYRRQLQYRFSRLAARETLRREELLARFFDMPFMGMALTDPGNGKWLKVNTSLEALLGYDADTLYQRDWQSLTHPDDLLIDEAEFHRLISGDINAYQLEKRFIHANGHVVPVRIYIKLLRDSVGAPEYSICMVQDLTRERADRQALQRQSDLYNMLSRINQLTLYSRSIDEVLQSACRIAVEEGKLRFAWIGRCDEQSRLVEAITYAGDTATATGFDQLFTIFACNPGQGLSEQAVMNGRTEVINDSLQASQYQPWHDFSRRFQCLSAIALPLRHKGRIFANLTLYADTVDFFTPALVNTLEEMAGDIGFALDTITRDEALEAANQVINSSPFVLIRWQNSPGWPILFVSDNIRSWGIEPQTLVEHSGTFEAFIHPDDQLQIADDVHRFLQQGETTYTQTYRLILPQNDTVIWVEDKTHVLRDASGEVVGLEGVLIDITERRQQESRLQQAVAVIQSTREAVLITGEDQQIVQVNPAFSEMFGWSEEALSGKTPAVLRSGCHDARFYRELWQQVSARGHWQGEIMSRRRSGEVFPALLSISRVCSDTDEVTHYVGVYTDLSRLKDSESRLEHLSTHDALTGLPNRKALFHELEYCGQYNRRHARLSALLMLDLDNFRDINDSYGHLEGDRLLLQLVSRLRQGLDKHTHLYRLGGDEFAVLLEEIEHSSDAAHVVTELMRQLAPVFRLDEGSDIRVSASFGISLIDTTEMSPQVILQQADAALFKAKEQRGSLSFFSDDLTTAVRRRLELEQRLRRALERKELCLYYQPQWSIDGAEMTGVEALIRWQDPERGMIPPVEFIPVAEQSILIGMIGRWVLHEASAQIAAWQRQGLAVPRVAVNVSPQQLRYHYLPDEVAEVLEQTGIAPDLLELELTESALMAPGQDTEKMLNALRALGVRLAIDDFGTGYSSLAYLKRFPLDLLKIDKSFTDDLLESSQARAIVETIIVLGHKLGLGVLAEGVEYEAQRCELERLGCHQFQGYLKSRPLSVVELEALLAAD